MSRAGEVTLLFGGEERVFRLAIGQWRKIQEKCDAGPPEIARRLGMAVQPEGLSTLQWLLAGGMGSWKVDDVREPIFQGLIGGGLTPNEAGELCRAYIDERPLTESVVTAMDVVLASLIGAGDEPLGERKGEAKARCRSPSPRANSGSEKTGSTASAKSSALRRGKSTPSASGSSRPAATPG